MKHTLLTILGLAASTLAAMAIDNNTVEVKYNGQTATVTVAPNISSYVTVSSGTSAHVRLVQSSTFSGVNKTASNADGEIIYVLSGTTTDGEFYLEGSFKCTVTLNGLTLTNPSGPAVNIQNGKRVEVSAKNGTTNTLTDGANDTYNGCFHSKGHTKLQGKGTLNIVGRSKHAIYSKEYVEVKNLTLNITAAPKDGIHCKEYFLMKSGTLTINGALDDGIQVELASGADTGQTADHEDENSGNFYQAGGTLSISGYGGKAVKADGTVSLTGGQRNFTTADTQTHAAIASPTADADGAATATFTLGGRRTGATAVRGVVVSRQGSRTVKRLVK